MRIQSLFVKTEMQKDLCLFNDILVHTKELYKKRDTQDRYKVFVYAFFLGSVSQIRCIRVSTDFSSTCR